MTEEEAKTKWCPMVRQPFTLNDQMVAANRSQESQNSPSNNCIGSACMMWRNYIPHVLDPKQKINGTDGYCGLANK